VPRFTVKKLLCWAEQELGISCVRETLRKVLRDLGMSYKQGKLLLARGSAVARALFAKKLKGLLRAAKANKETLVFIDEAHIHQDADLGPTWCRRGQPFYVTSTSPGLERVSFFGAYVYNEAKVCIWPTERANASTTIEFLENLRAAYPTGRLRVCWDGASYHRAEEVYSRAGELRIKLTQLPAYSPEFMPVEALWRWTREEVTYNHCHDTASALIAGVEVFEAEVNAQPQVTFSRLAVRTSLDPDAERLRIRMEAAA
jgi:transposase